LLIVCIFYDNVIAVMGINY